MLNVLVLAEAVAAKILVNKLQMLPCKIVAVIAPHDYDATLQQKFKADQIVTNNSTLSNFQQVKRVGKAESRQQVKAVTHQGIRLVPITNIYYFQAEHKYVTAYHTQGQLLLEDSLNSLQQEFPSAFIRIHRKTLVAIDKIAALIKDTNGQYYVKLHGKDEALLVSRRQLPLLRKVL